MATKFLNNVETFEDDTYRYFVGEVFDNTGIELYWQSSRFTKVDATEKKSRGVDGRRPKTLKRVQSLFYSNNF